MSSESAQNSQSQPTTYRDASTLDPQYLFHAASRDDWERRSPSDYQPASFADEGFIHLSSASQLLTPLHSFYIGRDDLLLLTISEEQILSPVVWEDLYNGGQEFPHVYGPLNLSAIVTVSNLPCDSNGKFDWLAELS